MNIKRMLVIVLLTTGCLAGCGRVDPHEVALAEAADPVNKKAFDDAMSKGMREFRAENYVSAATEFERALKVKGYADNEEAKQWLERAEFQMLKKEAERGMEESQCSLAMIYLKGRGDVRQDYAQAMRWFFKAAKQGDAEAQYQLGRMYELGLGVKVNLKEAMIWYRKAAKQGHKLAEDVYRRLS